METKVNDYKISPAFIKAAEIRMAKRDYGKLIESFPFGDKSFCQMIHIKTKRLVNLAEKESQPNCEPVIDSILDLINYASYYWEWLEGVLDE